MIPTVESSLFASYRQIRFAMSTREGGVSPKPFGMNLSFHVGDTPENVRENRRRFFDSIGIRPESVAFAGQCHSNRVEVVHMGGFTPKCDGLLTDRSGIALAVSVADCLPLFLFDPVRNVIAAVHAGWRGTAAQIASVAVTKMIDHGGSTPSDVVAYMGPCADVCCYEIGEEVAEQFNERCIARHNGRTFANLKQANFIQLLTCGVASSNIEVSGDCTICAGDRYHSYRREKEKSGRMLGVITLV
jgi:YfiH family protein